MSERPDASMEGETQEKEAIVEPTPEDLAALSTGEGNTETAEASDTDASVRSRTRHEVISPISPPPRRLPQDETYCILLRGQEVAEKGKQQKPRTELWIPSLLTPGLAPFAGPTLTEVVPVSRDQAVMFFGRRSRGEGLDMTAIPPMIARLPPRQVWMNIEIDLDYKDCLLETGVRMVAEADIESPRLPGRPPANPFSPYADIRRPFGLRDPDECRTPEARLSRSPSPRPRGDSPLGLGGSSRRGARLEDPLGHAVDFERLAKEALTRRFAEAKKEGKRIRERLYEEDRARRAREEQRLEEQRVEDFISRMNALNQPAPWSYPDPRVVPPPVTMPLPFAPTVPPPQDVPAPSSIPAAQAPSVSLPGPASTQSLTVVPSASTVKVSLTPSVNLPAPVEKKAGSRRSSSKKTSQGQHSTCCSGTSVRASSRSPDEDSDGSDSTIQGNRHHSGSESRSSRRRRRRTGRNRITINDFKIENNDPREAYENFVWDIERERAEHSDEKILPFAMEALVGPAGRVARTVAPPVTLQKILDRLKEFYGDVASFIQTSRQATALKKGENESVSDYGVRILTSVSRMLRTFPAHMQEREREQCLKESLYLGLPPSYQSQLAHLRDDPVKTFQDMMTAARTLEGNIDTYRGIHMAGRKDGSKSGSGFGKTYNIPNRHLKGTSAPVRSTSIEVPEGEYDFEEPQDSEPMDETEQEVRYYAECLARATQARFAGKSASAGGDPQSRGGSVNYQCYICLGPHPAKDCDLKEMVHTWLRDQGLGHFLEKGGSKKPTSNPPRPNPPK